MVKCKQTIGTSVCSRSRSVRHSAITRWTQAVLSLGKLCSEHGCSYEWKNGETPRLTKNGTTITCIMDNFVPLVVPGLSSSSSSSSASTSRPKNQSKSSGESEASTDPMTTRRAKHACGNRCRQTLIRKPRVARTENEMDEEDPKQGIPDGLQPFTENLEDLETHVPAHPSEREISDSEGDASKVETQKRKHSIFAHFPKDRKWDMCLRTKNYEGSVQKTPWSINTTCREVWSFDYSRSQSPQWRKWIPEQSPIRCRGTRSRHSVVTILSV